MKKALLVLVCLILFAGCGKPEATQSDSTASPPSSSAAALNPGRPESAPGLPLPGQSAAEQEGQSMSEESAPEMPSSGQSESQSLVANTPEPVAFPEVTEVSGGLQYSFSALPETAGQMEEILDQSDARHTAALFMAALVRYVDAPEEGIAMIDVLRGPQPMSDGDKAFLKERLSDKAYLPLAYFEGATPQNNYTPEEPLTLTLYDNPAQAEEGYHYVLVSTAGADSKRRIVLREKDGNFYLWEYPGILSGIRLPAKEDPWA